MEILNFNPLNNAEISIEFSDIFDLKEIQQMQDVFSDATGVASLITHPDGTPITTPSNFCRLCSMVRNTKKGYANCVQSDRVLGKEGKIFKDTHLNSCLSAGLWDTGTSIIVDGKHIANWLIGQVRNENLSEDFILTYADEIGADRAEMVSAFREVPVMTAKKFEKVAKMLVVFANEISEKAYNNFQLKIQMAERQNAIDLLHKSEEKYRTIFENIQDVFFRIDMNGVCIEISPSVDFYTDFNKHEILGKSIKSFYKNKADRLGLLNVISAFGEIRDYELDIISKSGVVKHVSINARINLDSSGSPTHIDGAVRDITKRKNAENALKQNETFLRETQFIAKLGTFKFDVNQDSWQSSEILDVIMGLPTDYDKTYIGWQSLTHPDWMDEVSDYFSWKVKELKPLYDIKYKIIRKTDGQERWVHTLGRLFYDDQNRLVQVIGTLQDITERKNAKEALRDSQEQLKYYAAHLQNVREEERLILAREIHDDLGQILIAIKIDLGMIKQRMKKMTESEEVASLFSDYESIMSMVDSTINSARKIMTELRPEVLYLVGFAEAVKLYSANFQTRYKIECNFVNEVDQLALNSQQTVALYRIVQESLSNVARHSNAKSVLILLQFKSGKLVLEITDDGIGFDQNKKVKNDSYGLIGMKERAFLLDGQLSMLSQPGNGTSLKIEMSYKIEKVYS